MRSEKYTLSVGQEFKLSGGGKGIVIRRAAGLLQIETDKGESLEVGQGDKVRFDKEAGSVRIKNLHDAVNEIRVVLIGSSEGDLEQSAGVVEIANAEELVRAASGFEITEFIVPIEGVMILASGVDRRSALISVIDGSVDVSKAADSLAVFSVAGVLEHTAKGELWARGDNVRVQVLEYLV